MTKQEFLSRLERALSGLPESDKAERLAFYSEMIDDRREEGLPEDAAVDGIGSPEEIASQIIEETPLPRIVRETVRTRRHMSAGEIVLLVLGFPVWFPLLIAVAAVLFSLYIVIWSVIFSFWAVDLALLVSAVATLGTGVWMFLRGDAPRGLALTGAAFLLAGLTILFYFACLAATKGALSLTKKIARGIKSLFLRKENSK